MIRVSWPVIVAAMLCLTFAWTITIGSPDLLDGWIRQNYIQCPK